MVAANLPHRAEPTETAEVPPLATEALVVALGGRTVLRGLDLNLGPGWTAVVGPNGAGKSTLLRALSGLLPPQSGRVLLGGRALADWRPMARARCLAWLAQQGETSGELDVRETVELGRLPHLGLLATPGPRDRAVVAAAMRSTECSQWASRPLQALSGGERQRVLLARALATEAPWLLLDEPTTHLDAPHQVALARLFRQLSAQRRVVTVLHDLAIALQADRLLVLHEGRVAAHGPASDAALHRVLESVFDHAVCVEADARGRWTARLALPD